MHLSLWRTGLSIALTAHRSQYVMLHFLSRGAAGKLKTCSHVFQHGTADCWVYQQSGPLLSALYQSLSKVENLLKSDYYCGGDIDFIISCGINGNTSIISNSLMLALLLHYRLPFTSDGSMLGLMNTTIYFIHFT